MPAVDGHVETAYVNANFVRGHDDAPQTYIAAMGPLKSQLVPWWRMVWKLGIDSIVCTTKLTEKGVSKCAQYAPKPHSLSLFCIGPGAASRTRARRRG